MSRKRLRTAKKIRKQPLPKKRPQFTESPLVHLRRNLRVVAARLRRSSELAGRHALEKPDLSLGAYLARLRKRKAALIKDIRARAKKELARGIPDQVLPRPRPPLSGIAELYERSLFHELARTKQLPPLACNPQSGWLMPIAYGEILYSQPGIHHDSTYSVKFDTKWMEARGHVTYRVELNDDASIWRNDDPDWVRYGFEVYWELPEAPCDCTVDCQIELGGRTEFNDGADDGAEYQNWIALANTDQDGEWPTGPIDMSEVGSGFGGGNVGITILTPIVRSRYFFIRKGKRAQVALGFVGALSAQDGLAELIGQLGVHRVGLSTTDIRPPLLSYTMDPWDPACFITTAVCRALGKADDCYELNLLRKFR
ncbi:MAG: hypothetical protein OES26_25880, partial [Gammaproteobacteria bacterium]|nr:hypothetical protein [Gammaproteobacteria bacterium]